MFPRAGRATIGRHRGIGVVGRMREGDAWAGQRAGGRAGQGVGIGQVC